MQTNLIASGAAYALEKLKSERTKGWDARFVVGVATFRHQNLLGDAGIALALKRIVGYKPRPKPIILDEEDSESSCAPPDAARSGP